MNSGTQISVTPPVETETDTGPTIPEGTLTFNVLDVELETVADTFPNVTVLSLAVVLNPTP